MATPGSGKKHRIVVLIGKNQGKYVAAGGNTVERIGGTQSETVKWEFQNQTMDDITVTVGNFSPASPCPINAAGCQMTGPLGPVGSGGPPLKFDAKLSDATKGNFTYDIVVTNNANPAESNKIDPELQIDGKGRAAKTALIVGAVVVAVAVAAYLLLS
jgi:hypothetical protein